MPYEATVYRVMIASPSDVMAERQLIREAIHDWNSLNSTERRVVLLPVGWETHAAPSMGERAQAVINEQVGDECDLLIGTFWTRIGTPTGDSKSGSVEEINRHINAGKPAMIYFSTAPVVPDSLDQGQYDELKKFKVKCQESGLTESYSSHDEFSEKLIRQLTITLNHNTYFKGATTEIDEESTQASQRVANLNAILFDDLKEHFRIINTCIGTQDELVQHLDLLAEMGSARSLEVFDRYADSLLILPSNVIEVVSNAYSELKELVDHCSDLKNFMETARKTEGEFNRTELALKGLPVALSFEQDGKMIKVLEEAFSVFEGGKEYLEEAILERGDAFEKYAEISRLMKERGENGAMTNKQGLVKDEPAAFGSAIDQKKDNPWWKRLFV